MADWIQSVVESSGAVGIALLMFLENLFPPIPSELIMPLAGYKAALGEGNILVLLIAGTIGSLAGATFWYVLARLFSEDRLKRLSDRYGRVLTLTREEIDKADGWFHRHGHAAVLFGRLIPTVRTLISIPAGLAEMPLLPFLFFTSIGTGIWTAILTLIGYWAGGHHEWIDGLLNPVSYLVVGGIILIYLYRVITYKPSARAAARTDRAGPGAGQP